MKTALITGGNSGIGKETARALAAQGWKVLIAARDAAKSREVVKAIRAETPNADIDWLALDLTEFDTIEAFAKEVTTRMPVIDALILNAGLYTQTLRTNRAGYETMFAATHLGHFLLTHYLLANVKASSDGRIVLTSSVAHQFGGSLTLDSVRNPSSNVTLQIAPTLAYGFSKLANLLFVRELAKRLKGTSIKVNAFHPGAIRSGFWRDVPGWLGALVSPVLVSEAAGARLQIRLASEPGLTVSGEYWARGKVRTSSAAGRDPQRAAALWDYSEKVFGIKKFGMPAG
jgi:NAD(P)-dependent dehydrogenase (short-subunit alcohol dehydrogenase family)